MSEKKKEKVRRKLPPIVEPVSLILRGIPRHDRELFHSYCIERGMTMSDALRQYIRRCARDRAESKSGS